MAKLKDPYDDIDWNHDLHHRIPVAKDYKEEKRRQRKHISEIGERWIGHVYDLIVLFTLAAVVAILLKLFLK
jgi:hypothetical protein